jgi:hypothetical protein
LNAETIAVAGLPPQGDLVPEGVGERQGKPGVLVPMPTLPSLSIIMRCVIGWPGPSFV